MARKRKVNISKGKAFFLVLVITAFCGALLYFMNKPSGEKTKTKDNLPSIAQRFEDENPVASQSSSVKPDKPSSEKPSRTEKPSDSSGVSRTSSDSSSSQNTKPQENTVTNPANTTQNAPAPATQNTTTSNFNFPKAQNNAQLIFVFDDGGQNLNQLQKFLELPFPITVAVLPGLSHSKESAQKIRKSGNEVMLHQPMQAVSKTNLGPGAITSDMTDDQILSTLFTNITEIGRVAGINNHEGSLITADAEKMALILKFTSENELFFLDSRTNVETKVPYVAQEMGFSYYERNIFLDNIKTKENALSELKKGLALANKNGTVIMIGHIWSADFLPAFLKQVYPELKKQGYRFSVVSKSDALKY